MLSFFATITLSINTPQPSARQLEAVDVNVTDAPLAGELSNDVVKVNVALFVVSLNTTPPAAIVYVLATPVIVSVSPASGALRMLAIINVVPVCDAPCTTGAPYGGIRLLSYLS